MIEKSRPTRFGICVIARCSVVLFALCAASAQAVQPVYVYVANYRSAVVSAYRVNTEKAGLVSIGVAELTGVAPTAMAVDSAGKFLYVANNGSGDVSAYRIDAASGVLIRIDADPLAPGIQNFPAGDRPESIAVDPSGRFAYVANWGANTISAYTINPVTGALSGAGVFDSGTQPRSLAIAPSGRFIYVANEGSRDVWTYSIGVPGGALVRVSSAESLSGLSSFAIDRSGKYAYATNFGGRLMAFLVDSASGALRTPTLVPFGYHVGDKPRSIAIHPGSRFLYIANETSNDLSAYALNFGTGFLRPIDADPATPGLQRVATGRMPYAVAVDPYGRYVYTTNWRDNTVSIFSINASGALKLVGTAATRSSPTTIVTTRVPGVP